MTTNPTAQLVEALERIRHEGKLSADEYSCANCNAHAEIADAALTQSKAIDDPRAEKARLAEQAEPWRNYLNRAIREADGAWGHINEAGEFKAIEPSEDDAALVKRLRHWEGDGHPHGLLHRAAADRIEALSSQREPSEDEVSRLTSIAREILQSDLGLLTDDFDRLSADEQREVTARLAEAMHSRSSLPPSSDAPEMIQLVAQVIWNEAGPGITAARAAGIAHKICAAMRNAQPHSAAVGGEATEPPLSSEHTPDAGADHAPGSAARDGSVAQPQPGSGE